jgi:hypothetical protein
MKVWKKAGKNNVGETLFVWRHRATNRFFLKIGSWLLGGFVFAILASIIISIFPHPPRQIEDQVPWIVFFIVFMAGIVNSFIRNIYNGLEFRILKNGIANVKPQWGFELLGFDKKKGLHPFGDRYEFIPWNDIKEIKEKDDGIQLVLKNDQDDMPLAVSPVVSYFEPAGDMILAHNGAIKFFSQDAKVDKDVLKLVLQKSREAKRNFNPA